MLACYGKFEDERPFAPHCVIEQRIHAFAQGDSVGRAPRSEACEGARLHKPHDSHLGQAIGPRRHLKSLTARQRMSAPMLKRQSAAFKRRRVIYRAPIFPNPINLPFPAP